MRKVEEFVRVSETKERIELSESFSGSREALTYCFFQNVTSS